MDTKELLSRVCGSVSDNEICIYNCGDGTYMRLIKNASETDFIKICNECERLGYTLFQRNDIDFCPAEKVLRVICDPYSVDFEREEPKYERRCGSALWQFENDHSYIDCGMCYILRCADNSFFIIDGGHFLQPNDHKRIYRFLRERTPDGEQTVISGWFFSHAHDDHVSQFVDFIREYGSAVDIEKLYYNDAPIFEYIYGRKQGGQALPILLIATTAGTGSEGNWTAVFTDTDHVKKGFALPALYPKESIVDPELMTTLSSRGIAGPGFDALAHAIESFLSVRANPFSKLYSRQAILWLSEGLPKVQANPSDLETWERVALGSTFAGIAIGNAGCTAPHGIEHPISGLLNVAHGEGLAAIYPEYMRFMRPHAQADFAELARLLGAETSGLTEEEASLRAVEQVDALLKTLGIAFTLSDLGVRESQLDWLSRTALDSMPAVFANNPAAMTSEDVKTILERRL